MAYFYSKLLLTFIGFVFCIPAFFKEKREVPLTLLFVLFFFLNEILTTSMAIFGIRDIIGKEWNWSGKILASIVFIIIIIILRKYKKFDFGFTFKQKKGSLKPVLIFIGIISIIHIVSLWFTVSKGKPSLESHLFQLTIPGISEEIAYRGLLLGILNVVFKKRIKIWGASLGYGTVVISILFHWKRLPIQVW
ncbi:MAG: hypothetical protein B1H05_03240 [Candidatus Cloacimonas sp. 4484_140]|nr:MAG: hypothetical protein B1H05_03240 [Candidatus Cloacimonas sp. 4484_140]